MVLPHKDEEELSPEEKENVRTEEIMGIYNDKYGKKSLFDDLWAQSHPEEAQELEKERRENQKRERMMLL